MVVRGSNLGEVKLINLINLLNFHSSIKRRKGMLARHDNKRQSIMWSTPSWRDMDRKLQYVICTHNEAGWSFKYIIEKTVHDTIKAIKQCHFYLKKYFRSGFPPKQPASQPYINYCLATLSLTSKVPLLIWIDETFLSKLCHTFYSSVTCNVSNLY